jgi:hypothetical protein
VLLVYEKDTFTFSQKIVLETREYTLAATDDCQTVVLTPINTGGGSIFIIGRNSEGKFSEQSQHSTIQT